MHLDKEDVIILFMATSVFLHDYPSVEDRNKILDLRDRAFRVLFPKMESKDSETTHEKGFGNLRLSSKYFSGE